LSKGDLTTLDHRQQGAAAGVTAGSPLGQRKIEAALARLWTELARAWTEIDGHSEIDVFRDPPIDSPSSRALVQRGRGLAAMSQLGSNFM